MRIVVALSLVFGTLALALSAAQSNLAPVWSGPKAAVEWRGMQVNAPAEEAPKVAEAGDDAPEFVGYNKRGDDWWVRLRVAPAETVLLRRGATTASGWLVADIEARGNRVIAVTVSRGEESKILKIVK